MKAEQGKFKLIPQFLSPIMTGALTAIIVMASIVCTTSYIYTREKSAVEKRSQDELIVGASALASKIDADAHERLGGETDETLPEYLENVKPLREFAARNPEYVNVYTASLSPEGVRIILDPSEPGDSDLNGVEDHSPLGEIYSQPSQNLLDALRTGQVIADEEPYTDQWGTYVSAYAPILTPEGRVVGVACVDMHGDEYLARSWGLTRAVEASYSVAAFIALIAGICAWAIQAKARESRRELLDVNDQLQDAVKLLKESDAAVQSIAANIPGVLFRARVTRSGARRCTFVSPRCRQVIGVPAEMLMKDASLLPIHANDVEAWEDSVIAAADGDGTWSHIGRMVKPDGSIMWIRGEGRVEEKGDELDFFGHVDDVTERHESDVRTSNQARIIEQQLLQINEKNGELEKQWSELRQKNLLLEALATTDQLTGLANRLQFKRRLEEILSEENDELTAILFIDLDNFKYINDSLGHDYGDRVLVEVADRLKNATRTFDVLARLGGDEFTIILRRLSSRQEGEFVAQRILEQLEVPILLDSRPYATPGSIGISFNDSGQFVDEILREADSAMYQAKAEGKSRAIVFESWMNDKAAQRLQIESDLRAAIEKNEFHLVYQPIVELTTGRTTAFEALIRWNHPERGSVSPMDFIPVAEDSGLIVPIGEWVIRKACLQAARWRDKSAEFRDLIVSVNVSGRQFEQGNLLDVLAESLRDSGLPPRCLQVEITETAMIKNLDVAIPRLEQIQNLGIKLAMDDFGTGYSSLGSLVQLPVDSIKIDRAFIRTLLDGGPSRAILGAVTSLCDTLQLNSTAEGVETEEQRDALIELGCTLAQGFLFSTPMVAGDVITWLRESSRTSIAA